MARSEPRTDTEYYDIEISSHGTARLPISVCELLGLEEGDRLVVIRDPDGTRKLAPLRDQLRKVRGMYAHLAPGRSMVDELIADRREKARREDEESQRPVRD